MLSNKQVIAVKLMVSDTLTQKEIASRIKVTENTICNWKRSSEFKEELNKQIKEEIFAIAPKALKKMNNLLNAKSEMVQLLAAKEVLNRAGFNLVEKSEVRQEVDARIHNKVTLKTLKEILDVDEDA
jgi:transposase